ncbi:hypothetical protein PR048_007986 [Dryococelus australis]|uniref:Uncharacterized protein n=1 Tax=Dryococelus australis TaxID=614101 RepID=A0ABQ9HVT7_9NEOP|nr:hypothetical protein PR048_007986 [Dryococelus australis]
MSPIRAQSYPKSSLQAVRQEVTAHSTHTHAQAHTTTHALPPHVIWHGFSERVLIKASRTEMEFQHALLLPAPLEYLPPRSTNALGAIAPLLKAVLPLQYRSQSKQYKAVIPVAERLACSSPTKAIQVQSPAGSLRIFACGSPAGRCCWSAGFLGDLPFSCPFIPALLHIYAYSAKSDRSLATKLALLPSNTSESRGPISAWLFTCQPVAHPTRVHFAARDLEGLLITRRPPPLQKVLGEDGVTGWWCWARNFTTNSRPLSLPPTQPVGNRTQALPHASRRVARVTPHLAVWDSLLVSLQVCYWLRVVQGVSNKLRTNCKVNASAHTGGGAKTACTHVDVVPLEALVQIGDEGLLRQRLQQYRVPGSYLLFKTQHLSQLTGLRQTFNVILKFGNSPHHQSRFFPSGGISFWPIILPQITCLSKVVRTLETRNTEAHNIESHNLEHNTQHGFSHVRIVKDDVGGLTRGSPVSPTPSFRR